MIQGDPSAAAGRSLEGMVTLVIGGGNGLGRAVADRYARDGARRVVVADRDLPAAVSAAEELAGGVGAPRALDVSDPAACATLVDEVAATFEGLDVMVNCAALCLVDPLLDLTPDRWDRVFNVNARGAFFAMQAAARPMVANGFGRIIHISTPASRLGFPPFATYGASKAALDSLVRAAAIELAPHGVTVNSIVPGRMTGGMVDVLEQDLAALTGRSQDDLLEDRTQSLPMRRRVSPDEVAAAASWLASREAGYVTAERFNFTGGMELG